MVYIWASFHQAKRIKSLPIVPPVIENALPAEKILVRAAQEPTQELSAVLLRAAEENAEVAAEELLRATESEKIG
jgi:hypothetical protein